MARTLESGLIRNPIFCIFMAISTTKEAKEKQEETADKKNLSKMAELFSTVTQPATKGEITKGAVHTIDRSAVYIDLAPYGTGRIYGREYVNARDIIKNLAVGDSVTAIVVDDESEEGYIDLSLKEARQALIWSEAEQALSEKRVLELPVMDANKGGLIMEWQGIQGFIPASQLKPEHYPRVDDADKDKILEKLGKLVGEKLSVSIIGVNPQENKLIFSEKGPEEKDKEKLVDKYQVGDVVEGEITGIVDFGIFIKIEEGLEGLAHISELDWALVEDPRQLFTAGEKLSAKIIEIKDGQISLSVKALKDNPWTKAAEKFEQGQKVDAVVIKYNKHGALASIEEGVAGLVHISEFESPEALREALELGKTYSFTINLFEPKDQRMTLSYKKES